VFGSKSSCFKCGAPKGGGGGGGGSSKATTSVQLDKDGRDAIRDALSALMADEAASPLPPLAAGVQLEPKISSALQAQGFQQRDIIWVSQALLAPDAAEAPTLANALNWLLLRVPESRLPRAMREKQLAAGGGKKKQKGGGGGKKKAGGKARTLTPEQKAALQLSGMGFELEDCIEAILSVRRQTVIVDSLKELFGWSKIMYHNPLHFAPFGLGEVQNSAVKALAAAEKTALKALFGKEFKDSLAGPGQQVWRVRFWLTDACVPPATNLVSWCRSGSSVSSWVKAIAAKFDLKVREHCVPVSLPLSPPRTSSVIIQHSN
jgi:hypothetical protein|tara:strand:+ start:423 stop:1379 length:957 start_codon:yes stop_codon:yes gene_type:complete